MRLPLSTSGILVMSSEDHCQPPTGYDDGGFMNEFRFTAEDRLECGEEIPRSDSVGLHPKVLGSIARDAELSPSDFE